MEPPQSGAEGVDGGGGNQQEGCHQGEDALEHQRHHGHHAAGDHQAAQPHQGRVVQERVHQSHGTHQRQDDAQLVKTQAHGNPRRLKHQHRVEHHHHQGGQVIFRE